MLVDVRLKSSGLVIRDAGAKLRAKFGMWPWDRYDYWKPADPNRIGMTDVDLVYQLGARTPKAAYESLLRQHGQSISSALASLPASRSIEEIDLAPHRDAIIRLFDIFLGSSGIKLAGATKLLYLFRPRLLPVIDSVLDYYYWYATSMHDEQRFRSLQRAVGPSQVATGDYVFQLLELMRQDVLAASDEIDSALAACRPEPYAGASRVRALESLLWLYYARPDASGVATQPPA